MTAAILPKYNVGDTFYVTANKFEDRKRDCPDCLGEKTFKVIAPSGAEYTADCPRCGNRTYNDVPSLWYRHHTPGIAAQEIVGYCVNEWGKNGITYRSAKGHSVEEDKIVTDEAIAMAIAEAMAAENNAHDAQQPERIHKDHLAGLELKEATINQFQSGLYASWSAFRHLRAAVEAVISNEDHCSNTRDEIVEGLEQSLSDTMRYSFVFEGFTRAMEAVVALVNASGDEAPAILTSLREQWKALPQQVQEAWQPKTSRVAKTWDGKPCPTY